MHYTSMAAMRLAAMCRYSAPLVALSIAVAIAFSLIALQLTFLFREERAGRTWRKAASALLMGAAISVMHYTAMAAADFMPPGGIPDASHAVSITSPAALGIAIVSVMILAIAIVTFPTGTGSKSSGRSMSNPCRRKSWRSPVTW